MKRIIRKPGLSGVAAALIVVVAAGPAHASLESQMDSMFDAMTNVTDATAVMGQRRGVLAGGHVSVRTNVMNAQIVSVVPPGINAGCGGIDLFGGSFSFISADQLIQVFRSVAQNAASYAFSMALQAMCPTCQALMNELQSKIQALNKLAVNSCQAGKMLVNTAISASPSFIQNAVNDKTGLISKGLGATRDAIASLFTSVGKGGTPDEKVANTEAGRETLEEKGVTGNIVWSALQESNATSWWPEGDEQLMEVVMSVTGSVIVRPDKKNGEAHPKITQLPPILDVKDFLGDSGHETTIRIYNCLNDECYNESDPGRVSNPGMHTITFTSYTDRVESMVRQLAEKFATNQPLTSEEAAFMTAAPGAIGGMIRNLARLGPGMARLFANRASRTIAQLMAANLVLNMVTTVEIAMSQSESPITSQVMMDMDDVAESVRDQIGNLNGQLASLSGLLSVYTDLMRSAKRNRIGIAQLVQPTR